MAAYVHAVESCWLELQERSCYVLMEYESISIRHMHMVTCNIKKEYTVHSI